jgi:hypothetical protein
MVCGIVGLLLALSVILSFVGGPLGIVAVVLGIIGVRRVGRGEATNRGMAITGIVTGAIAVAVAAAAIALIISSADEIEDLGDCLEDANTEQERDDCANRFEDELEDK